MLKRLVVEVVVGRAVETAIYIGSELKLPIEDKHKPWLLISPLLLPLSFYRPTSLPFHPSLLPPSVFLLLVFVQKTTVPGLTPTSLSVGGRPLALSFYHDCFLSISVYGGIKLLRNHKETLCNRVVCRSSTSATATASLLKNSRQPIEPYDLAAAMSRRVDVIVVHETLRFLFQRWSYTGDYVRTQEFRIPKLNIAAGPSNLYSPQLAHLHLFITGVNEMTEQTRRDIRLESGEHVHHLQRLFGDYLL